MAHERRQYRPTTADQTADRRARGSEPSPLTSPDRLRVLQGLAGNAAVTGLIAVQRLVGTDCRLNQRLQATDTGEVQLVEVVGSYNPTRGTYKVRPVDNEEAETRRVSQHQLFAVDDDSAAHSLKAGKPPQLDRASGMRNLKAGFAHDQAGGGDASAVRSAGSPRLPIPEAHSAMISVLGGVGGWTESRAGLASEATIKNYVGQASRAAAKPGGAEEYIRELAKWVKSRLKFFRAVPWKTLTIVEGTSANATFSVANWELTIEKGPDERLTEEKLRKFMKTIIHEARHCEQMSTVVWAALKRGDAPAVARATAVPLDIVEKLAERMPKTPVHGDTAHLWLAERLPVLQTWIAGVTRLRHALRDEIARHDRKDRLPLDVILDNVEDVYHSITFPTEVSRAVPADVTAWMAARNADVQDAWNTVRRYVPKREDKRFLEGTGKRYGVALDAFDEVRRILWTIYRETPLEWDAYAVGSRAAQKFKARSKK